MIIEPQILVSLIRMYYICNQKTKSPLLLMLRIKDGFAGERSIILRSKWRANCSNKPTWRSIRFVTRLELPTAITSRVCSARPWASLPGLIARWIILMYGKMRSELWDKKSKRRRDKEESCRNFANNYIHWRNNIMIISSWKEQFFFWRLWVLSWPFLHSKVSPVWLIRLFV